MEKKKNTSLLEEATLNSNNINCCFTCCQLNPDSSIVQNYVDLYQLCKVLKLPTSVLNRESSSSVLVCDSCILVLNEAIMIHKEIERLENQLEETNDKIKTLILKNFVQEEEEDDSSKMSDPLYAIKKSFVQCWKKGHQNEDGIKVYFEYLSHEEAPATTTADNSNCQLNLQNESENTSLLERTRSRRIVKSRKRYGFDDDYNLQVNRKKIKTITKAPSNNNNGDNEEDKSKARGEMKYCEEQQSTDIEIKSEISNEDFSDNNNIVSPLTSHPEGEKKDSSLCLIEKSSNKVSFKCTLCKSSFKHESSLDAHIRGKHEGLERPFKCNIANCNKSYKKKGHLEEHKKVHGGKDRPFVCHFCDNTTNENPVEQQPIQVNSSSSPPLVNPVISFSTEKKLRLHILSKHKSNKCEICGLQFKSPYVHARHLTSHESESNPIKTPTGPKNNFVCEFCGAKYTTLKRLKFHQMRHTSDKPEPFSCKFPNCDKVFSEPRTLQIHMASVHDKVFKYYCKICGIGCQQVYMLNRHMLCHTNEKKFCCGECGQRFKRKPQLISHEMKHTGQRPFSCSKCPKSFREKKKLKMHEFLHSELKPHACEYCDRKFALPHYLTHHINTAHKNKKVNDNDNLSIKNNLSMNKSSESENNTLVVECVNESQINSNVSPQFIIVSSTADNTSEFHQHQNNNSSETNNMITIETEDSSIPHQIVLENVLDQPKLVQVIQVIPNIQDSLDEDPSQNVIQETVVYTTQEGSENSFVDSGWIRFGFEPNT